MQYPASRGFSRPDTMLRRERNQCKQPSTSLIEPPSSTIDENINSKQVKAIAHLLMLTTATLMRACCQFTLPQFSIYNVLGLFIPTYCCTLSKVGEPNWVEFQGTISKFRRQEKWNFIVACLQIGLNDWDSLQNHGFAFCVPLIKSILARIVDKVNL